MAVIDYKLLSKMMRADSKSIKTATRNTLNDLAKIGQKSATSQATQDLKFTGNARNALGLKIKRASYSDMEASIYTDRKWMHYHLDGGTRGVGKSGISYNGSQYLLMPVAKHAFTRKGKLLRMFQKNNFVVRKGGTLLYLHKIEGVEQVFLLGILKKSFKHNEDTDPEKAIKRVTDERFIPEFKKSLDINLAKNR